MKKTLLFLTLAASLGLTHAAENNSQTETATLTYSNTEAASKADAVLMTKEAYGVAFTLKSEPSRLKVSSPGLTEIPSFSTFDLQSIAVQAQTGGTSGYQWNNVAAFLIDDTTKKVLAHAGNTISSVTAGEMATFTFSSLTLNTDTAYRLLFVPSDSLSNDAIKVGATMTSNYSSRYYIGLLGGQSQDTLSECKMAWGYNGADKNPTYAPIVSIQGQARFVPEPTTATLSLLALAGLAARRRRK